jgi:hypothetical protein
MKRQFVTFITALSFVLSLASIALRWDSFRNDWRISRTWLSSSISCGLIGADITAAEGRMSVAVALHPVARWDADDWVNIGRRRSGYSDVVEFDPGFNFHRLTIVHRWSSEWLVTHLRSGLPR